MDSDRHPRKSTRQLQQAFRLAIEEASAEGMVKSHISTPGELAREMVDFSNRLARDRYLEQIRNRDILSVGAIAADMFDGSYGNAQSRLQAALNGDAPYSTGYILITAWLADVNEQTDYAATLLGAYVAESQKDEKSIFLEYIQTQLDRHLHYKLGDKHYRQAFSEGTSLSTKFIRSIASVVVNHRDDFRHSGFNPEI